MATADTKTNPAVGPEGKTATPGKQGAHLDLATLGGMGLAMAGIIGGLLLEKGSISDVAQGTAAMIVLGGTFGAVLVTTPMAIVVRAFKGLGAVFFERRDGVNEIIELLIVYAGKARKNGIVSLEDEASSIEDPFLRKALNLAVDGTDMQEIRKMMEIDIALSEHRAESEAKVWESAGGYAPTIGIIGAVLGLIQVMKHLEDIKEVGHGIAVAFVATVYGVGLANIFFLPAANKLKARMREATLRKDVILEGVIGIVEGLNPTLLRLKLEAYQTATTSSKKAKMSAEDAGGAAATRGVPEPASAKG
ncbi:MAG: MotA/TolQ/ExbB proton channel [Candidatus Solibacter sp.]|jgi:chemotaxis protein MotA|nr:MotA/TolQ/ExbB proton channel [Candidatus Solibacter sp.]